MKGRGINIRMRCVLCFFKGLQETVGVPVVDPVLATLKQAEWLVEVKRLAGWGHSKVLLYGPPPEKEIRGWNLKL
ncbi:MAG: hypothetical protein F7B61_00960 [Caldisphaeraceae archaeon]|nr:hypothetical protein [Caldisphaeraceae archaeon]